MGSQPHSGFIQIQRSPTLVCTADNLHARTSWTFRGESSLSAIVQDAPRRVDTSPHKTI